MGRPRMLRDEKGDIVRDVPPGTSETENTQGNVALMPKSRLVKASKGELAVIDERVNDLSIYDGFKGYDPDEKLPEPEIKTNTKGIRFLKKAGEPRFMFRGDEFIKVYRGLGGKKTTLFWRYNQQNSEHRRVRSYLKKRGIPGA